MSIIEIDSFEVLTDLENDLRSLELADKLAKLNEHMTESMLETLLDLQLKRPSDIECPSFCLERRPRFYMC